MNSPATTVPPVAVTWGCLNPRCGYALSPSTLPSFYKACPLCGSTKWGVRPNPPALDAEKQGKE